MLHFIFPFHKREGEGEGGDERSMKGSSISHVGVEGIFSAAGLTWVSAYPGEKSQVARGGGGENWCEVLRSPSCCDAGSRYG